MHWPPLLLQHGSEAFSAPSAHQRSNNNAMLPAVAVLLQVICHGIPDQRELVDGDIVNVDVTAYIGGYHGDLNETFTVGQVRRGTG
jgi:methionine aminopeptidase